MQTFDYVSNICTDLCCSVMAPLIAEYDRHMNEMTEQLQTYQVKDGNVCKKRKMMKCGNTLMLNMFPSTGNDDGLES